MTTLPALEKTLELSLGAQIAECITEGRKIEITARRLAQDILDAFDVAAKGAAGLGWNEEDGNIWSGYEG